MNQLSFPLNKKPPATFLLLLFYFALCAIKMRDYLAHGRFWAEEGTFFYADISNGSFIDGLFYIFNGHIEIVTNLIVTLSTLVEIKYAPLVTTYLSLIIQTLPVFIIILYRKEFGLGNWKLIPLLVIATGLPSAAEVWANSINLHFHFALLTILIAALPVAESANEKWLFRILLAVSGLSGIPANFLAIVFFGLAIYSRSIERWIQFGILAFTSSLQITILLYNYEPQAREFIVKPMVYSLAIISKTVIAPLTGIEIGNKLSAIIKPAVNYTLENVLFSILCSIPLIIVTYESFRRRSLTLATLVSGAYLLLFLNIFAALGDKSLLISGFYGGRYFYASTVIFSVCLFAIIRDLNYLTTILISIFLCTSITNIPFYLGGPNWIESLENAETADQNHIDIWPKGRSMPFPSNRCGTVDEDGVIDVRVHCDGPTRSHKLNSSN